MLKLAVSRLKSSFFYLASSLIVLPISLVTSPIFARNLTSMDFAEIGFFSNLQIFLLPIMNLSFYSYYMTGYHERSDDENDYVLRTLFSFLILINIVISTAFYLALKFYLDVSESLFNSYPLGLIVIFSGMFSMSMGFLNVQLRFKQKAFKYFLVNSFVSITTLGISILFVIYFKLGAFGKLAPFLLINAILFLVFYFKYIKNIYIDMKIIKNAMYFCYPLTITALLSLPVLYIDKFFLERLNNVNEFAFYNIADSISAYFTIFSAAILQAFEPDIFKFTGTRKKQAVIKILLSFIGILLVGASFFCLISERAVDFLTSGRYLGATVYMFPMLITKCLEPILYFFGFIIVSLNLTKLILFNQIVMVLISIPLYLYLIHEYSFLGAVYAKITIFIIWLSIVILEIYLRNSALIGKLYFKHEMA
jgi:O-antigen/teichoic acid export membrane protein